MVSRNLCSRRPLSTTHAPSFRKRRAVPAPIPEPAPVTMTTLEKVVRALFDNTVAFLTTPGHPPTCMTLAGAVGCSVDASPARDIMIEIRKQNEVAMSERFLQARKSGDLSKDVNIDDYTRYLSSILAGL